MLSFDFLFLIRKLEEDSDRMKMKYSRPKEKCNNIKLKHAHRL